MQALLKEETCKEIVELDPISCLVNNRNYYINDMISNFYSTLSFCLLKEIKNTDSVIDDNEVNEGKIIVRS